MGKNYLTKKEQSYTSIEDVNHVLYKVERLHPEFIYVSIEQFNDEIKGDISEWLYMLKHSQINPKSHSIPVLKASERLDRLKMTKGQLNSYDQYMYETLKKASELETSEEKGVAKGREEGREEGIQIGEKKGRQEGRREEKIETAKNMLKMGIDHDIIIQATGLSEADLKKI